MTNKENKSDAFIDKTSHICPRDSYEDNSSVRVYFLLPGNTLKVVANTDRLLRPSMGKAYGFFNSKASRKMVEEILPALRDAAQTPNDLEISLFENTIQLPEMQTHSNLHTLNGLAQYVKNVFSSKKYVTEPTFSLYAGLPNATNRQTADELAAILNQAYQSSLYQEGEEFIGPIVHEEEKGEYVFRE